PSQSHPPRRVIVLSVEASPPPRSLAAPSDSLEALTHRWVELVTEAEGDVWEQQDGSLLVVWTIVKEMGPLLVRIVETTQHIQWETEQAGYQTSAGIAPGVARVSPHTQRPNEGWELAGPFYLARWMMNLSAHRGRVLLTEVGSQHVNCKSKPLGCIPIQGNRYISLYELA
ncbi:MAG: hypothetical protein QGG40_17995, partial [Myxococcota bacterium]|nr:hypothetical protein [Myxococcota bacterium]